MGAPWRRYDNHLSDARSVRGQHHGEMTMKAADADIFILPGLGGGSPDHWYRRWEPRLSSSRVLQQEDWDNPLREDWVSVLTGAISEAEKPVVLIAHSLGTLAVTHALCGRYDQTKVRGAFLVGVPDPELVAEKYPEAGTFAPAKRDPLPFPSLVVASRTDEFCDYDVAADLANAWGSLLIDAGDSGHLNADSGHGPWPEGTFVFARFLSRLQPED